ncbi:tape measure protein [Desulfovibrio desulfuricans]|uniref:tape measure protein n=1 Tax=Desulfovibrio desulfuricans TaxID=876 RepID=UPI001D08E8FB|nr:tape measure protein [Desulfovibrio desulfuricans]MCB6541148.1 tape measure protein [Desulfovibrio desulfuricans]MCB6552230.1 tape measure protein [Desulfovibrio desulfuricans]MCB6564073.1 tape measure protein [Desulfovibrio desulfuricans]MCB7345253.1 tape measure protein [Desulfovibrio desulfuricans]MCQ5217294.1 tape measure protein [Desulfovibrio desulfuricans]
MTAESGISISVGLDTSPFQKDLAAFRTMSEKAGKQVAQALENSVSPTKITKGFNDLARSINTAAAAGKNLGASINVSGLDSLAKQAGVSASGLDKMYESMVKNAQNKAFTDSLRNIQKLTGASADEMNRLAKSLGGVGNEFSKTDSGFGLASIGKMAAGIVTLRFALAGTIETVRSLTDAMLKLSRLNISYSSIFGGEFGATQQLDYIYNKTQSIGLEFQTTAETAKVFFAAAQGTTLQKDMNGIFYAVSNAAAALQMSTDDVQGVFRALGQMVSKGSVQAEELRGQLGERLPGAFQLAAKAMNMSTAELDKFMADGKLTAEDLLPKLAQALEEKYAAAATKAANSVQGSINRMTTEWELFKASVLDSDAVVGMLNRVTGALQGFNEVSKREAEVKQLSDQLAGMGIAPTQTAYFDSGDSVTAMGKTYSNDMLNWMRTMNAGWEAENQIAEQNEKQQEAILSKANTSVKNFLKNSKEEKVASLTQERDATLKAIQDAIDSRQQSGVGADDLIGQRTRVLAEYQSQLEKLNKEAGGKGLANKQFKFDTGLEQLRQEVANMEATINPASLGIEKLRNKLELEKQNALAAAEAHAKLSVQRKEATPAEAEEKKSLEVRKAELTYTQKLAEAEEKGRQTRVEFYKDFAELSGNYTESLQAQAEAIAKQGEEYRNAGIPEQLERQWEALKKLQTARDPLSGLQRGVTKFGAEYGNLAAQVESATTSMGNTIADTLSSAFLTGKLSAADFFNSVLQMAAKAASNYLVGQMFSGIGSLFSGSSVQTTGASSSWANFGVTPGASMPLAKGGAVGGGSISDYSNSIVTRPTYFSYGVRAFARGGAGLMGEAGDEGVFPLSRDSRGNLAVSATGLADIFRAATSGYGSSNQHASQPQVYLNINNSTGEQVAQQVKTDNNGNIRADIWVGNTAAKQMAKPGTAANQTLRSGLGIKQRAIGR